MPPLVPLSDQNTGPASNVNITRSIVLPGAHDENCNVNITALEGLGDSFSDDSEWISATHKDLDNTLVLNKTVTALISVWALHQSSKK